MATVQIRRVPAPAPAMSAFPQADSLPRLLDVLAAACHSPKLDEAVLAETFRITQRQCAYYYSAAQYVGLVYKRGGWIKPTTDGEAVNRIQDQDERRAAVFEMVLKLPVFSDVASSLADDGDLPPAARVAEWVLDEDGKVNQTTAARRAETVLAWIGMVRKEAPEQIQALGGAVQTDDEPVARMGMR